MSTQHRLPLDRSREFREYDYPREPPLYTPLVHFIQRFKEPNRYLTDEVVNTAITEGELRDNGDGCACFVLDRDGVAYYLIAGWHDDGYRVMVSGWPHLYDRQTALDAGWSHQQLEEVWQLNQQTASHFSDEWEEYVTWSKSHPDGGVKPTV